VTAILRRRRSHSLVRPLRVVVTVATGAALVLLGAAAPAVGSPASPWRAAGAYDPGSGSGSTTKGGSGSTTGGGASTGDTTAGTPVGGGASGPASEADKTFLANVHLAVTWQTAAGEMAVKKGSTEPVREAAQQLNDLYGQLDRLNTTAARSLGVPLPARPTDTERIWLDDLENASGPAFDDLYVMLLRQTDGRMFPHLGAVRSMTASPVVRQFTQKANDIVLKHMDVLEGTGLVQFQQLPPAGDPAAGVVVPKTRKGAHGGAALPLIWAILAFGAIGLGVAGGRLLRPTTFGGRDIARRPARRPAVPF
jgi:predicted outer membrane protein